MSTTTFLFCCDPFDIRRPDPDYAREYQVVCDLNNPVLLFDFDALTVDRNPDRAIRTITTSQRLQIVIYRGWMLNLQQYTQLYNALLSLNYRLVNSPDEYRTCHYLPDSLPFITSKTPQTIFGKTDKGLSVLLDDAEVFGSRPVIIKDYVKSEKHHWETACFVADASDRENLEQSIVNLLELRGENLNEGVVIRAFVELNHLTIHSKSGMPLTEEYRLFFYENRLIGIYNYWEEGEYTIEKPNIADFVEMAESIPSHFFCMDIARTTSGEWIIIELGDAQVAGLPEETDIPAFYKRLVHPI